LAWAIEDLDQMGQKGLEGIENVGPRLAGVLERLVGACV
jgi:hypothetical protein